MGPPVEPRVVLVTADHSAFGLGRLSVRAANVQHSYGCRQEWEAVSVSQVSVGQRELTVFRVCSLSTSPALAVIHCVVFLSGFFCCPFTFIDSVFVPLSVCLSVCLPACLSVCLSLPVCHQSLSVCLSACLSVMKACLPVCLPASACLPACLCASACLSVCLPVCLS